MDIIGLSLFLGAGLSSFATYRYFLYWDRTGSHLDMIPILCGFILSGGLALASAVGLLIWGLSFISL